MEARYEAKNTDGFYIIAMMASLASAALAYPGESIGLPSSLDTAALNKIEVLKDEDGVPYFSLEITFPQSFMEMNEQRPADGEPWIDYYWKIDDGSWEYLGGGTTEYIFDPSYGCAVSGKENTYVATDIYPEDEGNAREIVIKDHTYTLRVVLCYRAQDESGELFCISSGLSNELSIGSGSYYQNVSDWAKPELQEAYDLGLIPDILIGADMTKPVTREEFCELAVGLYEKTTGTTAEAVSPNPFTDTTNERILKAYKIGITNGTSETTFSPTVSHKQGAVRRNALPCYKSYSAVRRLQRCGVKDFPDQQYISGFAVDATKYMFKAGIILGDAQGNFMPKATTSVQTAAGYGMATREQAIALTLRTYKKYQ